MQCCRFISSGYKLARFLPDRSQNVSSKFFNKLERCYHYRVTTTLLLKLDFKANFCYRFSTHACVLRTLYKFMRLRRKVIQHAVLVCWRTLNFGPIQCWHFTLDKFLNSKGFTYSMLHVVYCNFNKKWPKQADWKLLIYKKKLWK